MYYPVCESIADEQPSIAGLVRRIDAYLGELGSGEIIVSDLAFLLSEDESRVVAILDELSERGTLIKELMLKCRNHCYYFTYKEFSEAEDFGDTLICPVCNAEFQDRTQLKCDVYRLAVQQVIRPLSIARSLVSHSTNTLLYATSNPHSRSAIALDSEWKAIENCIRDKSLSINITKIDCWSTSLSDLRAKLLAHEPNLVHLSGHGFPDKGFAFSQSAEVAEFADDTALAELFRLCPWVECVLLNACYSAKQAELISKNVHCCIGISGELDDMAAVHFTSGFYDALIAGHSYDQCFAFGLNSIKINKQKLSDLDFPVLWIDGNLQEVQV